MYKIFRKFWFYGLIIILALGVISFFDTDYSLASQNFAMTDWMLPLPEGNYRITQGDKDDPNTCQQGWSHCSDQKVLKCAIDLAAMNPGDIEGFPLLAPNSGKIGRRGWDTYGGGYYLYIEHDDGLISHYEHLRERRLDTGYAVQKGDCVGRVSNTGGNYSPHLHFVVLDGSGQNCMKIYGIDGNTNFNYSPSPNWTIVRSTNHNIDEITNCPGESPTPPVPPSQQPLPPPSASNNQPNRPSIVSPYNWQELQNQTPELCAMENGDSDTGDYVTGYFFQIYNSAQNWDSGWIGSSCVSTTPLGYFTYKWHVKVRDTQGKESEWSEDWNFTVREGNGEAQPPTNNPPNTPSLISPYDWQEFQNITPQLCASQNGDPDAGDYVSAYRFEIYDSAQNWDSGWVSNSCILPPKLDANTYKWHVKVRDSNNSESNWSTDWHFTIWDLNQEAQPTPTFSISLDIYNFDSVIKWIIDAILHKQVNLFLNIIGPHGTKFNGYAMGMEPLGYNNGPDIVNVLEKVVIKSQSTCIGYLYNTFQGTSEEKAEIFFSGLDFDWESLGLTGQYSNITAFGLYKFDQGWELLYISPIDTVLLNPDYFGKFNLNECPEISSQTQVPSFPSSQIAFLESGKIKLMNADGSKIETIIATNSSSFTWSPNGKEVAFSETVNGKSFLKMLDLTSMEIRNLVNPEKTSNVILDNYYIYSNPRFSSDGTKLLFVAEDGRAQGSSLRKLDLNTSKIEETISPPAHNLQFDISINDDIMMTECGGGISACEIKFANSSGKSPWTLFDLNDGMWFRDASWSPDGSIIAFISPNNLDVTTMAPHHLFWLSKELVEISQQLFDDNFIEAQPDWSPDGNWIVVSRKKVGEENADIWIVSFDGNVLTNITNTSEINETQPAWRP